LASHKPRAAHTRVLVKQNASNTDLSARTDRLVQCRSWFNTMWMSCSCKFLGSP